MSRQNKRMAKKLTRNAEGGPRDRHLAKIAKREADKKREAALVEQNRIDKAFMEDGVIS